jgi:hypothetical protein
VRIDVTANRVGSPLDGVLSIRNAAGAEIVTNDDQPMTSDPGLQFNVPSDAKSLFVVLSDRAGRGGADFVYHLSATQVGQPDFSLAIMGPSVAVPGSGVTVAHVRATRTAYNGPIQLSLDALSPESVPEGVTLSGTEIPAGATDTLLAFHVGKHSPTFVLANLVGEAVGLKPPLRRTAQTPTRAVAAVQPWLRDQLPLAVVEPSALRLAWEPASGQSALPLGSVLPISLRLTRSESAKGIVRVSLLTSQVMPTKRVAQVDKKKKPLPDKIVDDLDRALRLKLDKDETSLMLAADKNEATAEIIVPGDLVDIPYDVTLKAELLHTDGKRVVAEAYAPMSRLRTTFPFTVELTGAAKVEAKAGLGEIGMLQGKIVRTSAFQGPVTVTLRNLPPEFAVPTVVVAANKDTFTLPIALPYHTPKGEVKGVQLAAEGKGAFGPIQSNALPVALTVVAGAPPEGPLRIFEDEASFAASLNEGDGTAKLDAKDRLSGRASLVITPDKMNPRIPGLGMKITENPKPGEYRYLRFAWKSQGGHNIMLQLYPSKGDLAADPKRVLAYEAGDSSNRRRLSAQRISEAMPNEWTVVTRDLFADFGAFTLEGLGFSPGRAVGSSDEKGMHGLYDQIYLGRTESDFAAIDSKPTDAAKDSQAAK